MTTNHPANGPVSLERLHQIREILSKAAAQSDGGNLGYAMADAVKVIDVAIAEFDAEPVEFLPDNLDRALTILGVALPISKEEFNLDAERWMQRLINRVIRLESELIQPAPVVPDEMVNNIDNHYGDEDLIYEQGKIEGWNACRAAMLQAGNPPATPDTWIPVSERMPERDVDVQVYCADKKEQMVGYMERNEAEGWFRFASLPNGGGVYCNPTHWMPLPAAPQQEVKNV
ncbi:DUF551 domain-containing protein [Citrobacter portucalensis]|uniref:DUF551 domain-containing protein n=1 Tax=Citrobacter portucalensis TaxID=1639133 RepID=UPI00301CA3FB